MLIITWISNPYSLVQCNRIYRIYVHVPNTCWFNREKKLKFAQYLYGNLPSHVIRICHLAPCHFPPCQFPPSLPPCHAMPIPFSSALPFPSFSSFFSLQGGREGGKWQGGREGGKWQGDKLVPIQWHLWVIVNLELVFHELLDLFCPIFRQILCNFFWPTAIWPNQEIIHFTQFTR